MKPPLLTGGSIHERAGVLKELRSIIIPAMVRSLLLLGALPWIAYSQPAAIKPSAPIRLFDGKTLDNFELWQQDNHERDPDKVFSVVDQIDGAPAIRISG